MHPRGEGFEVRGNAGDGAVGKSPATVRIDFFPERVEEGAGEALQV
jgi:hypothetical protein